MSAEFTLWKAYAIHERLDGVEFKRGQTETFANLLHQCVVFRASGSGVFIEIFIGVSFKFANNATCDELHIAF